MQAAAGTCPLVLMRYCAETASVAEAQCRRAHLPAMGGDQIASMAAYAAPEQLIRVWGHARSRNG
jgi:hypothetical protein